ncbi:MAG: hypothetical protein Q8P57_02680 [Candidatus Pacearchaeota archaeon]|nr:hypothetical protein [Candidatus Pacearchaeota archaeon]
MTRKTSQYEEIIPLGHYSYTPTNEANNLDETFTLVSHGPTIIVRGGMPFSMGNEEETFKEVIRGRRARVTSDISGDYPGMEPEELFVRRIDSQRDLKKHLDDILTDFIPSHRLLIGCIGAGICGYLAYNFILGLLN